MKYLVLKPLAAAVVMCLSPMAYAQIVEEVEIRREGSDAIASIRFATPIQFRSAVSSRAGDLTQVYYDVLPLTDLPGLLGSMKRVPGSAGLPQIIIRDEVVARAGMSRKLVINFGEPTKFKVRSGRGSQNIELVLEGLGEAASRSFAPAVPPAKQPPVSALPSGAPVAQASEKTDEEAAALLAMGQGAYDRGDYAVALDRLTTLLALPGNAASRNAQELIGLTRLKQGDLARARSEFEVFLNLYPVGEDSDRVRKALASMPSTPQTIVATSKPPDQSFGTWSGSLSAFYYGGQSKVRTQEFLDSPISGLPQLPSENVISGIDQSQFQTSVDLNWRYRDAASETRFVFRDPLSVDLRPNGINKNRLSTLYFERRSFSNGISFRAGRQSPTVAGILYRFDGVQAGYTLAPKWRINAMAGAPTDTLLDTKRRIYGAWIEADALTSEISGSLFFNQQTIDGQVDRRAIGTELRYFSGGVSASAQLDYDIALRKTNIATVQGTWQLPNTTVANFLYDYRATPILSLGNILFFQDPSLVTQARRIQDLLGTTSLANLREQVVGVTAYQTQVMAGVTTPVATNWQVGGDVRLTNVGEVKPVAIIFPNGSPSTGNLWGASLQLIGSNLYSQRDTHVLNASYMKGPTYNGSLLSYNNLSALNEKWQLEPSLKFYRQNDIAGTSSRRWSPGLRVTYRVLQQVTLESELTYEMSTTNAIARSESSNRMFYYLGVRYDF